MNHIALYLEKFKEQFKDAGNAKLLLQSAIKEAIGITFPIEKIKELNGVVKIDCDPIERSIMLERRERLEESLKKMLGLNRVKVQ